MGYFWVPNIRCEINEGRAFLRSADMSKKGCKGVCSDCKMFRGVDLCTTGDAYLNGCCAK